MGRKQHGGGVAEDEGWLRAAAALARPRPPRWTQLPADQRTRLVEACAPGMRLLYGAETEPAGGS